MSVNWLNEEKTNISFVKLNLYSNKDVFVSKIINSFSQKQNIHNSESVKQDIKVPHQYLEQLDNEIIVENSIL